MMDPPRNLNAVSTPLNTVCLIEASAGTGKTYTIGSLYLRLLLQAGVDNFPLPLTVEQILVVTFTEAATEELKGRIRERIHQTKQAFIAYKEQRESALSDDPFLQELIQHIEHIDVAIQRLKIAEQSMDLAAIYTIHGFCRRMLMQYAFNSGVHFNLELVKDEGELIQRFFNEYWREQFYPLSFAEANYIYKALGSPQAVCSELYSQVSDFGLRPQIKQTELLALSLREFLAEYILPSQQQILDLKQAWLKDEDEIIGLIEGELTKSYKKGEKKALKRTTFKSNFVPKWLQNMKDWSRAGSQMDLPDVLVKYFNQEALNEYADEGATPITHPFFELADEAVATQKMQGIYRKVIMYHYLKGVQKLLIQHKLDHSEKGFNDLLRLLQEALYSEKGDELAQFIRLQYPFAMIDEFQDTDNIQYQTFSKIYIQPSTSPTGFIMIGDPKQAIYKFRGADIFTYFKAALEAKQTFTLGTNWRSEETVVNAVNGLFDFDENPSVQPFLYEQIQFQPVSFRANKPKFYLNGKVQPAVQCYVGDLGKESRSGRLNEDQRYILAETCAASIYQLLQSAVENQAVFKAQKEGQEEIEPLTEERIAVLVRDWQEADVIKVALQKVGIASVYLSDNSNVFDCPQAQELALILTACLNPFSERNILNAIATSIWRLTSAEINQIKQDEQRWTNTVDDFVRYQRIWQTQSILAMLHQLFLEKKIAENLLVAEGGERAVTDLLHLAELLQEASPLNESPASLLRWFEKKIQGENRQGDLQIRLESERKLVKIVTFHKSKGLEYDLVWLPFITNPPKSRESLVQTYFNEEQKAVLWDMEGEHSDEIQRELRAEEMRLLYVALTRAKYQVLIAMPENFASNWNAIQYLLTQGRMDVASVRTALTTFKKRMAKQNVQVELDDLLDLEGKAPLSLAKPTAQLSAATFTGNIEQNWQVTSFSALSSLHEKSVQHYSEARQSAVGFSQILDNEKDYDQNSVVENTALMPFETEQLDGYEAGYSPFDFPAGARVGKVLHSYFEKHPFNQPVEMETVEKICQQLQLEAVWQPTVQRWLTQVLHTPLFTSNEFCLSDLASKDCLKELEFYLKLENTFDVARFNHLLKKYHLLSQPLQLDVVREGIKGMLRGFIDLVFRHNGKYYLLDYKSNKLGNLLADYSTENLEKTMRKHYYDWQYLFYCVALHRYLKERDPNYQYESHFGGVVYAFLRGMDGQPAQGVYFTVPDVALIQELEELF
ncbi:exodeoxyribonuclease V subunit beta [Bisgaard Taxon 46]